MFAILDLQIAIRTRRIVITRHAVIEMQADNVTPQEVFSTLLTGEPEILEEYPRPKGRPYPMALILGTLPSGEALHSVWAFDASRGLAILVTVYKPDPSLWIDARRRRPKA